jgi:hypothetical protein
METFKWAAAVLWLIVPLFVTSEAHATPVVCSYGNADSTCMQGAALYAPQQTPPTICTGAGQTVASSPQWIGSVYTSGSCNYTPPPTCPPNTNQQGTLSWNGSFWVGSNCVPTWAVMTGWTPPGSPLGNCEMAIGQRQTTGTWQPYTPPISSDGGWYEGEYYWTPYGLQGNDVPVQYDTYFMMYMMSSPFEVLNYIGGDYQVLGMVDPGNGVPVVWSCDVTPGGVVQSVVPWTADINPCLDGSNAVSCGGGGYGN